VLQAIRSKVPQIHGLRLQRTQLVKIPVKKAERMKEYKSVTL
jgi:hypothetical protein